jgi:hypothetical protein
MSFSDENIKASRDAMCVFDENMEKKDAVLVSCAEQMCETLPLPVARVLLRHLQNWLIQERLVDTRPPPDDESALRARVCELVRVYHGECPSGDGWYYM